MDQSRNHAEDNAVEAFIDRWRDTGGKQRANYQLLLTKLCQLLELPGPEPAGPDPKENAYVFVRRIDLDHQTRRRRSLRQNPLAPPRILGNL